MRKIRFAIVGCGKIGERHARHIHEQAELVAVCDIIADKARDIANKYGCGWYKSIDEMMHAEKDLDVVSVCTPNGLHAQHTITALKAGFHVLCEKPMAIRVTDCAEMIKVAEQMNKRLFIVKQNRFNPPVTAVKEALDKGWLGKIYSIQLTCFWNRNDDYYKDSWKGTLEMDGGTLFTQFSHFIDLLYWFFGDVKQVAALTGNFAHQHSIEFEDTGAAILYFNSGIMGTINFSLNSYKENLEGSLTIIGEHGSVKIGGQYLNTLEYQCIKDHHLELEEPGNGANEYGTYVGSMSNHDKVYNNIIAVLQQGDEVVANYFEGMKTVELIERIYAAARKHKENVQDPVSPASGLFN